jgi:hypothetical protein
MISNGDLRESRAIKILNHARRFDLTPSDELVAAIEAAEVIRAIGRVDMAKPTFEQVVENPQSLADYATAVVAAKTAGNERQGYVDQAMLRVVGSTYRAVVTAWRDAVGAKLNASVDAFGNEMGKLPDDLRPENVIDLDADTIAAYGRAKAAAREVGDLANVVADMERLAPQMTGTASASGRCWWPASWTSATSCRSQRTRRSRAMSPDCGRSWRSTPSRTPVMTSWPGVPTAWLP